jgi:hypothetical protein
MDVMPDLFDGENGDEVENGRFIKDGASMTEQLRRRQATLSGECQE